MTLEEAKKVITTLQSQGYTNDKIADAFCGMCINKQITIEQLDALVNLLGYHLTEDAKKKIKKLQK